MKEVFFWTPMEIEQILPSTALPPTLRQLPTERKFDRGPISERERERCKREKRKNQRERNNSTPDIKTCRQKHEECIE